MARLKKDKLGAQVYVKSLGTMMTVNEENADILERNNLTDLFEDDTIDNKRPAKKSRGNVKRVKRPADAS